MGVNRIFQKKIVIDTIECKKKLFMKIYFRGRKKSFYCQKNTNFTNKCGALRKTFEFFIIVVLQIFFFSFLSRHYYFLGGKLNI